MTAVVELRAVSRSYRTRVETVHAVREVSLALHSGEIVGLVGPSGSGKTTLVNLVVGWDRPDAGSVDRRDIPAGWSGTAVVPQGIGLLSELSARENIELARRLGNEQREPTDRLLERLSLDELGDRRPGELSMGEQQRVAVARAVAPTPAVLVADEPTAHQDERNADRVMDVLESCAAAGTAVLLATHDARLLGHVDRVVTLLDGQLSNGA